MRLTRNSKSVNYANYSKEEINCCSLTLQAGDKFKRQFVLEQLLKRLLALVLVNSSKCSLTFCAFYLLNRLI